MADYAKARRAMVDNQLRTFDVFNVPLLEAIDTVPREAFVPEALHYLAYSDRQIPLFRKQDGETRCLLSPMVFSRMVQSLDLAVGDQVLDIACGFGYSSAVLDAFGAKVTGLEDDEALSLEARQRLDMAGYRNVCVKTGPLEEGYANGAPFDAILINGSIQTGLEILLQQLKEGGKLICVKGHGLSGKATLYVKSGNSYGRKSLFNAAAPILKAFEKVPVFAF